MATAEHRAASGDKSLIPLSRPSLEETDIQAVVDVLRSGWITTGAKVAELERLFEHTVCCDHAIAVNSATSGMQMVLHALGIGTGDEVVTPSMTWVSTPNMIRLTGATPVFVDVERNTLLTNEQLIARRITAKTRAVIPVHFAGASVDMEPIRKLCARLNIAVIEDAAHALGTHYLATPVGQIGTAVFSFHPLKNITTGEGGMVCTDDAGLAERLRRLRFHGLAENAFQRLHAGRAPHAEVIEPGFKCNLPDMNAVLAIGQLERLEVMNDKRRYLTHLYKHYLAGVDEIVPLTDSPVTTRHARHLQVVRMQQPDGRPIRDAIAQSLRQRGISTGLHFKAAHLHAYYYQQAKHDAALLENTTWNSARVCSLPLYPDMRELEVNRVVSTLKSSLRRTKD